MAKESNRNYFPHEYTAKDDPKCEMVIEVMGMEGYGIFWVLLEVLRAQPDYTYPVANIPIIARKYNADSDIMRRVVFDFGLFTIENDNIFFSKGLLKRMRPMDEKRARLSEAGKAGADKRWKSSDESGSDSHPNSHLNRDVCSNKNRIEDNREEDNRRGVVGERDDKRRRVATKRTAFVAPTLEEVKAYFASIGDNTSNADKFFDHFTANGWKTGRNPMKDWQAAARNWKRRTPEFNNTINEHETKTNYRAL